MIKMQIWSELYFIAILSLMTANGQYQDGDIRLVGGSYQWEGRVEVYMSGVWGTITDSDWTNDDATVVCRKLGHFRPGATAHSNAYFGEGKGPVSLDSVICSGSEYILTDCELQNSGLTTSHSLDVGVKCQPAYGSYREGDIRLVGGPHNWEGRVEIFWNGGWGTISDSSWTSNDARVVCRQLQHAAGSGVAVSCCQEYGVGNNYIHIHNVRCRGSESNITQCGYTNVTSLITHSNDVGVRCQQGNPQREGEICLTNFYQSNPYVIARVEIFLSGEWGTICYGATGSNTARVACRQLGYNTYSPTYRSFSRQGSAQFHYNYLNCIGTEYRVTGCQNGTYYCPTYRGDWGVYCRIDGYEELDIRLTSRYHGRVDVYLSNVWRPIADSSNTWTGNTNNAAVLCRQLGYQPTGVSVQSSYYQANVYSYDNYTTMDNIVCSGTESEITHCSYNITYATDRRLFRLICSTYSCNTGDIRLIGGDSEREGRVEMCSSNRWGTICDTAWSPNDTLVVCRYLGFSDVVNDSSYYSSEKYGKGVGPVLMDFVNCTGTEYRLSYCSQRTHYFGCSHDSDVGISCGPARCSEGQLKLTKHSVEYHGRVEICANQRWNTLSYSNWDYPNSFTVCNELGYQYDSYYSSIQNDGLTRHSWYYRCTWREYRLSDCRKSTETSTTSSSVRIYCRRVDCNDGELRLMDGQNELEGRLEVCYNGRWGTVGGDGWTETNSHVVCNSLGYDISDEPANKSIPNAPSKPLYYHSIRCSRRDLSLLECGFKRYTDKTKTFLQAIIRCKEPVCKDGDLRLVGGLTKYEGRLEVCFNKRRGSIDGNGWTHKDTEVACSQLGLPNSNVEYAKSERTEYGGSQSLPVFITHVGCYGDEKNLTDCSYHKFESSTSTSTTHTSMDVSISCSTRELKQEEPGEIRNATDEEVEKQTGNNANPPEHSNTTATVSLSLSAIFAVGLVLLAVIIIIMFTMMRRKIKTTERETHHITPVQDTGTINRYAAHETQFTSNTKTIALDYQEPVSDSVSQTLEGEEAEYPTSTLSSAVRAPKTKKVSKPAVKKEESSSSTPASKSSKKSRGPKPNPPSYLNINREDRKGEPHSNSSSPHYEDVYDFVD